MAKKTTKVVQLTVPETSETEENSDLDPIVKALTRKEFIDQLVEVTGGRKGEVRDLLDATLRLLSESIQEYDEVNIPPLGKIKVARRKDVPNGKVVNMRVRIPIKAPDSLAWEALVDDAPES